MDTQILRKAESIVDHLLLGIADLNHGIEWVRQKTGVTAIAGGSHPGVGTRNALLSMGSRQYLEIVAIDPKQEEKGQIADLVRHLETPRLITWAVATADIASVAQKAKEAGLSFEGPTDGSRVKPDSGILRWKTLRISGDCDGVIPFFIQWDARIAHPSEDSPPGCRLISLEILHPEADRVRDMFQKLGISATIKIGTQPRLHTVIDSPAGRICIS